MALAGFFYSGGMLQIRLGLNQIHRTHTRKNENRNPPQEPFIGTLIGTPIGTPQC
jgi:hypothetical protein